ncbi:trichodiene oxygenase [Fusarium pseudocircinatum]|uniref:Trichodiene oxygenase n=1 Tax=Fusarium pseudocircinatum TaxID=56676 RepID=A0A8H5UKI5_9HYPO|nr:trichodiene oxygenase [Fusarium pseudocircinatum]
MSSIKLIIPLEAMFNTGFLSARIWSPTFTSWNIIYYTALAFGGFALYWLCLVFYRLFLHPLRNVPGPKIAAATSWYESYQDVILDGHYIKDYPRLHEKVHINDPNFYHKVYSTGTKFLKEPAMFRFAGELDALPFIMDPAAHKVRRGIVNPMFSPRAIKDFSPLALQIIKGALKKIGDSYETGTPASLEPLESNFAMDIVMKLCFGKDMGCIQGKEGTESLVDSMVALPHSFSLIKHFPMLGKIMQSFSTHFLTYIIPGFVEFRNNGVYTDETGRRTVFDAILDAEPDRSTKGLVDEAFSLVIGGTETTVTTITYGVWCILKNPEVEKKMLEELRTVATNSDLMEYSNLMNLPYLTAVIHETLRISSPAPGILTHLSLCGLLSMLRSVEWTAHVNGVSFPIWGIRHQRGRAISLWSLGPLTGPVVGPLCAGFLVEAKGWRSVFWIITISGVAVPASFFILRESYAPVLLERKAKRLRKETRDELYQPRTKKKGTARELFSTYNTLRYTVTMFNTWKQNSNSYVVLPTRPPFEKAQNGKPRRSACNPCRTRKIRCTSEPDGCRNCRSRDLQCEYGTDSDTEHNFGSVKGKRQAKSKERSGSRSGGLMTPFTDGSYSAEDDSGSLQSSNMSEAVVQESEEMHPELHHMEPDWSEFMFGSPQDISSTPTNTRDFSHDTTFDSTVSMDQVLNSPGSFLTSPPLESMLGDDIYPHDSFPFPQSTISISETWPAETEQLHDHGSSDDSISSCQCSITPMETWEALTINVSSRHPTSQKSIQAQSALLNHGMSSFS